MKVNHAPAGPCAARTPDVKHGTICESVGATRRHSGVDAMKSTLETALVRLAHKHHHQSHEGFAETLSRGLHAIRTHLHMDVGFISEFVENRRYFRFVDAAEQDAIICVGQSDPLEESYCQRVVDGRLPELLHDACLHPEALTLPATRALPVGAHLSVPIRLKNGRVFGTLCCFSSRADHSLTARGGRHAGHPYRVGLAGATSADRHPGPHRTGHGAHPAAQRVPTHLGPDYPPARRL